MAQLETVYAIKKVLEDNAAVSTLVSDRVYPLFSADQKAKIPYLLYNDDSEDHIHHLGGASGRAIYEITVYVCAATDASMRDLKTKVRKSLDGYLGTVTVGADSVTIDQCHLKSVNDNVDIQDNASGVPVYISQLEFAVSNSTETS